MTTVLINAGTEDEMEILFPDELMTVDGIQKALDKKFNEVYEFGQRVYDGMTVLERIATGTMFVPGVGDVAGLAADAEMYLTDPDSRTWFNGALTSLGALPLIPAASTVRKIGKEYDKRFLYGTAGGKQRVGEADKAENLTFGIEPTFEARPPEIYLPDYEGRGFVTTMADRTNAEGLLTNVKGVGLSDPVALQGGKNYMFDNPGKVWASAPPQVKKMMIEAERIKKATGEDPLYIPWRMAPSGGDFSHMTSDTLINFARQNMSKTGIKAADKEIKSFLPTWKGIKSPKSNDQINELTGPIRDRVRKAIDKQRGEGGLSITEARLAVTDPAQLQAKDAMASHVGVLHPDLDIVTDSGHLTYGAGAPGEGLGVLKEELPIWGLLDDARMERELKTGRRIDPMNPQHVDVRPLQMRPYSGILSEEVLRKLGF